MLLFAAVVLIIGLISTYRAWYQVKSIDLHSESALRPGSIIETSVVSYGRTPVSVRLELIQDSHSEIVAAFRVRANNWAFFDPRTRHGAQRTFLTNGTLNNFQRGKALLRATATGVEQWTRLPPPLVREVPVEIASGPSP